MNTTKTLKLFSLLTLIASFSANAKLVDVQEYNTHKVKIKINKIATSVSSFNSDTSTESGPVRLLQALGRISQTNLRLKEKNHAAINDYYERMCENSWETRALNSSEYTQVVRGDLEIKSTSCEVEDGKAKCKTGWSMTCTYLYK